jgi:hypothetical protein
MTEVTEFTFNDHSVDRQFDNTAIEATIGILKPPALANIFLAGKWESQKRVILYV